MPSSPSSRRLRPVESYLASEDTQIHVSRLQLEVGLIHEIDLLHLVDALQSNAPGLLVVDGCELSWAGGKPDGLDG